MNRSPDPSHVHAEVAVFVPLPGTFHYRIPPRLRELAVPGARALVSFGRRKLVGVVLCVGPLPEGIDDAKVKDLADILDPRALFDAPLISLGRWMSRHYRHPPGETFAAMVPPPLRKPAGVRYLLAGGAPPSPDPSPLGEDLSRKLGAGAGVEPASLTLAELETLAPHLGAGTVLRRFAATGQGGRAEAVATRTGEAPAPEALGASSHRLAALVAELAAGPLPVARLRDKGISRDTLRRAAGNGWITVEERVPDPLDLSTLGMGKTEALTLTPDQARVHAAIGAGIAGGAFTPLLLWGVTGSGKSELYLRAAAETVRRGKAALILAPEISLTPQLIGRFSARFGRALSVLHSGLSNRERTLQYERIRDGEARVVIGTRSAVFAPLGRLGLVVVDEEHDGGYKQDDGLKYNAKHVALKRAQEAGATVVLGSATPELETFWRAGEGAYGLLRLPARVGEAVAPALHIVDVRGEERRTRRQVLIGRRLEEEVSAALARGEQGLLFLNRRGYAPAYYCPTCRETARCPTCSVALTLHGGNDGRLVCHYCGRERPAHLACRACGSEEWVRLGAGTQRLEEEARILWPGARVARLDRDAVAAGGARELLDRFARGGADILVGTQMIAKGHHFPRLTVVGIVSADEALGLPDFRAGERTLQTLLQVAGRAGRESEPGRVIIQTRNPEHPVLLDVLAGDYEGFARRELAEREQMKFPPFARLALVRAQSASQTRAKQALAEVRRAALRVGADLAMDVLGPAPAPLERLRGKYRFHLLLRTYGPGAAGMQTLLDRLGPSLAVTDKEVRLAVDVDPLHML